MAPDTGTEILEEARSSLATERHITVRPPNLSQDHPTRLQRNPGRLPAPEPNIWTPDLHPLGEQPRLDDMSRANHRWTSEVLHLNRDRQNR